MLCECVCGTVKEVRLTHLKSGATISCGCYIKAKLSTQNGASNTRLYKIWVNMLDRCINPKSQSYAIYGGRGICVCNEWNDFTTFKAWAESNGYSNSSTIERNDVDGNYEPNNCSWVSKAEQAVNKRKQINTASQYIGVFPIKDKFRAVVTYKNTNYRIGMFNSEIDAAKARDQFIIDNGWNHKLNF